MAKRRSLLANHSSNPSPNRWRPGWAAACRMANEQEIYQEHVLDHFEDPYHRGVCPRATHAHSDDNPLCGDFVEIALAIDAEGKIDEAWFDGDGCCISQASASMLIEHVEGRRVEEVKAFTANDMLELFGPKLTPNRQKCCLLPWRVLQTAMYSRLGDDAKNSART